MRGVISAGMVSALEHLGLTRAFDAAYGSSAGAINAAYFLAGQAALGTTIYYEDINNHHFIDLRRALWGRPIVDLGYLIDEVAVRRKPLALERVLASPTTLAVLATDVDLRAVAVLRGFHDGRQLLDAMRAGATMPVFAGDPCAYRGRRYLDASVTEPVPVPAAEADGHTHIVALLTRAGGMRARPSAFDRYFIAPRLRRLSPELAAQYLNRAVPYAALRRRIDSGTGPVGSAQVVGIAVPGLAISKLERRREILSQGAERGFQAVMTAFGGATLRAPEAPASSEALRRIP
jgi:predicted patatin/cPLA2 family phospholipase